MEYPKHKHTMEVTNETIHSIRHVGLKEAWFSIDTEFAAEFQTWLEGKGYTVAQEQWNHPQSLYVGHKDPNGELTVFSVKWP
jgi:hypothetical protein